VQVDDPGERWTVRDVAGKGATQDELQLLLQSIELNVSQRGDDEVQMVVPNRCRQCHAGTLHRLRGVERY